jgi:L-lactate dehydrogenase complex protein LldG
MKPARREILEKLRKAKVSVPEKPDFDEPVFHALKLPPIESFKNSLEEVNGNVHVFNSYDELLAKLKKHLTSYNSSKICCLEPKIKKMLKLGIIKTSECNEIPEDVEVGITGCEYLIAQTGSVLVSSAQKGGRRLFIYPPVHIVIASKNQLVKTLDEAYEAVSKKYSNNLPSQLLLITGPSRTADIEKTLTLGAHGPKELHVYLH